MYTDVTIDQNQRSEATTVTRRALLGSTAVGGVTFLAGCSGVSGVLSSGDDRQSEGRIYPIDTDASDGECVAASGEAKPATGSDAAPWFGYGGCGSWKTSPVVPGETYWILSRTDGGVLRDASYEIKEQDASSWQTQKTVSGPVGSHKEQMTKYVPETDRLRIVNVDAGFYVEVYGPRS